MHVSNKYNVPCSLPRHLALVVAAVAALGSVTAAADTTVTVLRIESSSAEKRYYEEVVAAYEAEHPDVNVEFDARWLAGYLPRICSARLHPR